MTTTVRQGLPRTVGGPAWPPSDVSITFAIPVPAAAAETAAAASAAPLTAAAVSASPPAASAPAAVGLAATLRRGLPRRVGDDPWPPDDVRAAFAVAVPGVSTLPSVRLPVADAADAEVNVPETRAATPAGVDENATAAAPAPVTAAPRPSPGPTPSPAPARATPAKTAGDDAATREPGRLAGLLARAGGPVAVVVGGTLAVVLATAVILLVRMWLWGTDAGADFVARYPGEVHLPEWAPVGFPGWLMWQHWLNAFFMVLVIKTGWTVRTTSRPAATWQSRRGGKKIAIEQWIHVSLDVLWLANGAVFVVLLFVSGQWIRVVPFSWEFVPNAVSSALQYVSMSWPTENGWVNYNALQVMAYFTTIFIAAPLAAATGFRMSPLWPAKTERLSKLFPIEVARKLHFPVMLYFVLFILMHVFLVFATGALRNLNHMFWGSPDDGSWAGFGMFALGMAVTVGAAAALRPFVVQQLASLFGRVGR